MPFYLTWVLCFAIFSILCVVMYSTSTIFHSACIFSIFPFFACIFLLSSLLHAVVAPTNPVLLACPPMQHSTLLASSSYPACSSSSLGWPFPSVVSLNLEFRQLSSLASSQIVGFSRFLPYWSTSEQSYHRILRRH